jgi:hypothetical protein
LILIVTRIAGTAAAVGRPSRVPATGTGASTFATIGLARVTVGAFLTVCRAIGALPITRVPLTFDTIARLAESGTSSVPGV